MIKVDRQELIALLKKAKSMSGLNHPSDWTQRMDISKEIESYIESMTDDGDDFPQPRRVPAKAQSPFKALSEWTSDGYENEEDAIRSRYARLVREKVWPLPPEE